MGRYLYRTDQAAAGGGAQLSGFVPETRFGFWFLEAALREFHRVLRPGGLLLLAESTRAYIHSWLIRYLFRHPMHLQRSAEEFQAMTRAAGFSFNPQNVSLPYLWWSRPDLGLRQLLGFGVPARREETLVNLVATKEGSP